VLPSRDLHTRGAGLGADPPGWWQRAQPSGVRFLGGITYTPFGTFLVWLGPVPPARGRIIHGQAPSTTVS